MEYLPDVPASEQSFFDRHELLVLPVSGSSPSTGHTLAEAMARGLREAGYPARKADTTDGINPALAGWAEEMSASLDVIWVDFDWALYDPTGQLSGIYHQEMAVSRSGWNTASKDTLAVIVREAIPRLHDVVNGKISSRISVLTIPSALDVSSLDQKFSRIETVVVSSEGLSRMTEEGAEMLSQIPQPLNPLKSDTQPEPGQPDSVSAPAIASPETLAVETLSDPVQPEQPIAPEQARKGVDEPLPEATGVSAPESAAPVSTSPALTSSETLIPEPSGSAVAEEGTEEGIEDETKQETAVSSVLTPESVAKARQATDETGSPDASSLPDHAAPQPPVVREQIAPGNGQPVFLVPEATGAPGDGNLSLPTALQQALREADATITGDPERATHIIQCSVRVDTPVAGRQKTRLVWTVSNRQGQEIGRAVQENDIPEGSLDQSWAPVAPTIARAAVRGIQKLFANGIAEQGTGGGPSQPGLTHVIAQ